MAIDVGGMQTTRILRDINTNIDSLTSQVNANSTKISATNVNVITNNTHLSSIEQSILANSTRISSVGNYMAAVNQNVVNNSAHISTLNLNTLTNSAWISSNRNLITNNSTYISYLTSDVLLTSANVSLTNSNVLLTSTVTSSARLLAANNSVQLNNVSTMLQNGTYRIATNYQMGKNISWWHSVSSSNEYSATGYFGMGYFNNLISNDSTPTISISMNNYRIASDAETVRNSYFNVIPFPTGMYGSKDNSFIYPTYTGTLATLNWIYSQWNLTSMQQGTDISMRNTPLVDPYTFQFISFSAWKWAASHSSGSTTIAVASCY